MSIEQLKDLEKNLSDKNEMMKIVKFHQKQYPIPEMSATVYSLEQIFRLADINASEFKQGNGVVRFKVNYVFSMYKKELALIDDVIESLLEKALPILEYDVLEMFPVEDVRRMISNEFTISKEALNSKVILIVRDIWAKYGGPKEKSKKGRSKAHPPNVKKVLEDWYTENSENPFPSNEERDRLAYITHLEPSKISTWFGNCRARHKRWVKQESEEVKGWLLGTRS